MAAGIADTEIAFDDDELSVRFLKGDSGTCIVAFAGVGHGLGNIQTEEFRRSLASDGSRREFSAIFVIDKKRRWYNHGLLPRVIFEVNAVLEFLGASRVITLGNSMGGFGAIIFAHHLRHCIRAIAFCPQSSVNAGIVPFETRWREWREGISLWDIPDAAAVLSSTVRYNLFFGDMDGLDMQHVARFRQYQPADMEITIIPNCGHDVAAHLRQQERLKPMLRDLISEG